MCLVAGHLGGIDLRGELAPAGVRDAGIFRPETERHTFTWRNQAPRAPCRGATKCPSSMSPSMKFIGGDPMKPATNRLAGLRKFSAACRSADDAHSYRDAMAASWPRSGRG